MKNFKKIKRKLLSIILTFIVVAIPITSIPADSVFASKNSINRIIRKNIKNSIFSENHATLIKILKYLGMALSIFTVSTASYYGVRFILDILNPDRVINRKNQEIVKQRIKDIDQKLLNLIDNDSSSSESGEIDKLKKNKSILEGIKSSGNNNTIQNTAIGFAGVGGAATAIKCIVDAINALGGFSKNILNVSYLRWAGGNFIGMFKEASELFRPPPKGADKEAVIANFDVIFKHFYGQKEAVEQLKSHLFDIIVAKDQYKWKGKKYTCCPLIYCYGPSGVGKSFIAKRLAQILLTNAEPLIMSSADVDKEKKESVVNQLFNSPVSDNDKFIPTKPLIRYLKNSPGGVVIFEEYDKICTPALDEIFRTAMEQGTINIDGEKIDCSGTTFIFTSNEDDISMEGFEKSDERKLDRQSFIEGYTRVWHSKSFLNRIKKVRFKNLTAKEYADIIRNHFDEIAAYWIDSKNADIKLNISDETIKKLAKQVEEINQGARPIDLWIIPEIQIALGNKIKCASDYDYYRGKSFDVVYDEQNKKLQLIWINVNS